MANAAPVPVCFGPSENVSPEERAERERLERQEVARWRHRFLRLDAIKPGETVEAQEMRCLNKRLVHIEREAAQKELLLSVRNAPVHRREAERCRTTILRLLDASAETNRKIAATKIDIQELESQIKRAQSELHNVTQAIPSDFLFAEQLQRSCRQVAALESRLHRVRTQENQVHTDNRKLREELEGMLEERARYNRQWQHYVQQLARNRKFLIDMIERATLAFNQSEELCHRLESLKAHEARETRQQVHEMIELDRQIVGTRHTNAFLRTKGATRPVAALDPALVRKRERFKRACLERTTRYRTVIEGARAALQLQSMRDVLALIERQQDKYLALFRYANETDAQLAAATGRARELDEATDGARERERRKQLTNERKAQQTEQQLLQVRQHTEQLKADVAYQEAALELKLETVEQALEVLGYDRAAIVALMAGTTHADRRKLTKDALTNALATIERKVMELVQRRTPEERPGPARSTDEEPEAPDVPASQQQCAECAEGQDVNQHDEHIVQPTEDERMVENVRKRIGAPEMQYRLHTLSQCKLPRSRMLVNKRYQ
ncbi:outer dynein arm protein 1-like [Anopheles albimanus]|uniref:ODAD1 central coiled coil region domain-containing protein n=1 Tax=Anopheles albimanus TaxID=7167 RepID=A0A182FP52_ANOAL|nr:outer dynein arm protein 1-like [Anopheles albimanus]